MKYTYAIPCRMSATLIKAHRRHESKHTGDMNQSMSAAEGVVYWRHGLNYTSILYLLPVYFCICKRGKRRVDGWKGQQNTEGIAEGARRSFLDGGRTGVSC